ncbi:MAG: DNA recombination protein RmuC, partial [Gammaproteobacteria bacterium]
MLTPLLADILLIAILLVLVWLVFRLRNTGNDSQATRLDTRFEEQHRRLEGIGQRLTDLKLEQTESGARLREELRAIHSDQNTRFEQRQTDAVKQLNESLQAGMTNVQKQVGETLTRNSDELGKRMDGLTQKTDHRLQEISGQVEKRLADGFEKTTATFADIVKRLALIDEAQKKITELSSNVVSLQEVLADKRSRGAFGEVQLNALVRNMLPEASFTLQHTLPNGNRADCVLYLPPPTGMIAIDAKFPLESYQRMTDVSLSEHERKAAEKQFKLDIKKHIQDIASKYIIPGTTSDGAVMFIPAEAIFGEIHAHHPDIVDTAYAARVWPVSPTNMMAILNTARAVLKDAATREQVHIIQEHLCMLAKDFDRFRGRMDNLSRHIRQAHTDMEEVHTSAQKISDRFEKIERVELENVPALAVAVD